ncbi:MAG: hypothetical protein ACKO40_13705 [Planctomycetaceae bacterium]
MTIRAGIVVVAAACLAAGTAAAAPPTVIAAPPGSGPVAQAHTRTFRHHRKTVRMIRRTPQVMQEDAARIKRGDLFSTWSNAASN